ncbi:MULTISPECIES: hypothetical protein [Cyanophyceae]|uniref:hypothetical protein n=1 Tax=Cyanophyceae TaxID=3028117 RepID=UPI0016881075|nr:hypothetical protein [Trichocoleus sp. FACHB-40]MBD2006344.1 hypothetical protein [Trichocoleus sp. FACHB-40]
MKLPLSNAYDAYLRGTITVKEWKRLSRDSNLSLATSTVGMGVIYLLNPALGVTVFAGTLLASVFDEYVVQASKYRESGSDIQIEDLEGVDTTYRVAYLKGDRIVPLTEEQVEALQELKNEFINLEYTLF